MHCLTVIRATSNHVLTKNHNTSASYDKVSKLRAAKSLTFDSLRDLHKLLKRLARQPDRCVIRGKPVPDAPEPLRRRRTHFSDTGQAWVMLDVDSVKWPKRLRTWPYTAEHAAYVRALLPPEFTAAGCVWQASASAGLDPKVAKLHLWFLLDAPLTSAQLRRWLADVPVIDRSTLRVVQPHYTADPIGGPEGKRLGILKGRRVCTPLELAEAEPEPAAAPLTKRPKGCVDVAEAQVQGAAKAAVAKARATLSDCQVAWHDAYKVGSYLGPAVALTTWNDRKHGHETWREEGERLAAKWGRRFAELPDTKHDADAYAARVLEGIAWGVAMERDRLAQQSAAMAERMAAATKEMQEQVLARLARNSGSEKALREAGAALGKFKNVIGEQRLLDSLRLHSGLSDAQCRDAIADAVPADLSSWREHVQMSKDEVLATDANTRAIFQHFPGFSQAFKVNARSLQLEVQAENPMGVAPGVHKPEALDYALVGWLSSLGMRKVSMHKTAAVFRAFVETLPTYDPFLDAFPEALLPAAEARKQLAEMKPRLDTWLTKHFGVEDTPLHRAFAAKTLIAAVARAVKPGTKVDTMLVLMGAQGIGKTSVVTTLANCIPDGYCELMDTRDKDALLAMHQGLLCEVSELRALRSSAEESLKAFWTRTKDTLRAPYGRTSQKYQRRMVFVGTTNDDDFLSDRENRRYWPVPCTEVCNMTSKQAALLWREAALRYAARDEKHWLTPEENELQAEAVADVRHENIIETQLQKYLRGKEKVPLFDAVRHCFPDSKEPAKHQRSVSAAMKAVGWVRKRSNKRKYWVKK